MASDGGDGAATSGAQDQSAPKEPIRLTGNYFPHVRRDRVLPRRAATGPGQSGPVGPAGEPCSPAPFYGLLPGVQRLGPGPSALPHGSHAPAAMTAPGPSVRPCVRNSSVRRRWARRRRQPEVGEARRRRHGEVGPARSAARWARRGGSARWARRGGAARWARRGGAARWARRGGTAPAAAAQRQQHPMARVASAERRHHGQRSQAAHLFGPPEDAPPLGASCQGLPVATRGAMPGATHDDTAQGLGRGARGSG